MRQPRCALGGGLEEEKTANCHGIHPTHNLLLSTGNRNGVGAKTLAVLSRGGARGDGLPQLRTLEHRSAPVGYPYGGVPARFKQPCNRPRDYPLLVVGANGPRTECQQRRPQPVRGLWVTLER